MGPVRTPEKSVTALTEAALDLTRESPSQPHIGKGFDFYEAVRRFEVSLIERALFESGLNITQAARLLGMNKTTLHAKIKRYNLKRQLIGELRINRERAPR